MRKKSSWQDVSLQHYDAKLIIISLLDEKHKIFTEWKLNSSSMEKGVLLNQNFSVYNVPLFWRPNGLSSRPLMTELPENIEFMSVTVSLTFRKKWVSVFDVRTTWHSRSFTTRGNKDKSHPEGFEWSLNGPSRIYLGITLQCMSYSEL